MGIKELEHLKKSLTYIDSKSSQLEKSKKNLTELKKQLSDIENQMSGIRKDISELNSSIKEQQFKIDNSDKLTKEQEIELKKIKKEITTINRENNMAGKTNKLPKYDFIEYWGSENILNNKLEFWMWFGFLIPLIFCSIPLLAISTFGVELGYTFECANGDGEYWIERINDGVSDCEDNSDEGVINPPDNPHLTHDTGLVLTFIFAPIFSWIVFSILNGIMILDWKSKTVDSKTTEKLAKLHDKQRPLDKIAVKFRTNNNQLERLLKDLWTHELLRDDHESSIDTYQSKISITEQEIENYTESIEETYDSIKHLIPYSDYLSG